MTPTISPSGGFKPSPSSPSPAAPGPTPCATNNKVIAELIQRASVGYAKYGVTVADSPLEKSVWLQHLKEELLDAAVYVQRLIDLSRGDDTDADSPSRS